jgi:hypothetical protein
MPCPRRVLSASAVPRTPTATQQRQRGRRGAHRASIEASVLGGRISLALQPGVARHDACGDVVAGRVGHGKTGGLGTARLAVVPLRDHQGAESRLRRRALLERPGAIGARVLARPTRSRDHALRGREEFSRRFCRPRCAALDRGRPRPTRAAGPGSGDRLNVVVRRPPCVVGEGLA